MCRSSDEPEASDAEKACKLCHPVMPALPAKPMPPRQNKNSGKAPALVRLNVMRGARDRALKVTAKEEAAASRVREEKRKLEAQEGGRQDRLFFQPMRGGGSRGPFPKAP